MIVAWLTVFSGVLGRNSSNLYQGNAIAQKLGKRELFRLEGGVRELDPKGHVQGLLSGGVQDEVPHRVQVELSGAGLNVAPIAADTTHPQRANWRSSPHAAQGFPFLRASQGRGRSPPMRIPQGRVR